MGLCHGKLVCIFQFSSVQFSHSVVSNSLEPHGLQHARLTCPQDYCDIEWFGLEMNRDHSVISETAPKQWILDSLGDYEGDSISSKRFLTTVVDAVIL